MARKKTNEYGNDSITTLKGAERVRKRPSVIFGSDGLEGCQHSVFARYSKFSLTQSMKRARATAKRLS